MTTISGIKPPVTKPQAWGRRQLRNNLGAIGSNLSEALLQNHIKLRANLVILSSFILISSRILVSYFTAKKAKGKKDEIYRANEFVRTFMREGLGFAFTYLVLAVIRSNIQKFLRHQFGGKLEPGFSVGKAAKMAVKEIRDYIRRVPRTPEQHPTRWVDAVDLHPSSKIVAFTKDKVYNNRFWKPLIEAFNALNPDKDYRLPDLEKLKLFYELFPLAIGSIFSISLSGYALELFNREYSHRILQKRLAHQQALEEQKHSVTSPLAPSRTDLFQGFYGGVSGSQGVRDVSWTTMPSLGTPGTLPLSNTVLNSPWALPANGLSSQRFEHNS